ncbi:MAG: Gfo/Idh/MocA family protein [Candidatus Cyclobacteriaceae bacterium M3_2C_046]
MKNDKQRSRRKFVKKLAGTSFMMGAAPNIIGKSLKENHLLKPVKNPFEDKKYAANDKIRLAAIGTGIIGFYNIQTALRVNGVELVAACDLYDGRLEKVKNDFGQHIFTTRNYQEILDRDDVDVVLIATPDHWHDHISIAAMEKGKAIYCEKPMVHHIEEGYDVIKAQKKNNAIYQVGSQGVSSIVQDKARQLYQEGAIGDLVIVEAAYNRFSQLGAWQYSIPPDASRETVDWDRFLGDAPEVAFDPVRFFRWRNYRDYGTGISGDLYVHLLSWLHYIIGSNGPERIFSTGGLRFWKDGRNVPDVIISLMDYAQTANHAPFNLNIRVNFVAGGGASGSGLNFIGTEGAMQLQGNRLTLRRTNLSKYPPYGGYDSLFTFPEDTQQEFVEQYNDKYYGQGAVIDDPDDVVYNAPEGYDDRLDHWVNLIAAIREGKPVVEDAVYGLRAAGPCLAANTSYFDNKVITWDPENMKVT